MVHMANQIAGFFAPIPSDQAIDGIADHLQKFWDPRMRAALIEYVKGGGAGLQDIAWPPSCNWRPRRSRNNRPRRTSVRPLLAPIIPGLQQFRHLGALPVVEL